MTLKEQAILQDIRYLKEKYDHQSDDLLVKMNDKNTSFEDTIDALEQRQVILRIIVDLDYILKQYGD